MRIEARITQIKYLSGQAQTIAARPLNITSCPDITIQFTRQQICWPLIPGELITSEVSHIRGQLYRAVELKSRGHIEADALTVMALARIRFTEDCFDYVKSRRVQNGIYTLASIYKGCLWSSLEEAFWHTDEDPDSPRGLNAMLSLFHISSSSVRNIISGLTGYMNYRETYNLLADMGLNPDERQAVFDIYGYRARDIILEDPWLLYMRDITSYERTSKIIENYGIQVPIHNSQAAAIKHAIATDGPCVPADGYEYVPDDYFIMEDYYGTPVFERRDIWEYETSIIADLSRLNHAKSVIPRIVTDNYTKPDNGAVIRGRELVVRYEARFGYSGIDDNAISQTAAMARLYEWAGVMLLTGPPGSGKTTIINVLTGLKAADGMSVYLLTFTGRSVKKLMQVTKRHKDGVYASTIHKYIAEHQSVPDNSDTGRRIYIIDEASMIDKQLMSELLRIIPDDSSIILAGDTEQIEQPAGDRPFREIVESGVYNHIILQSSYRYRNGSILAAAAAINTPDPIYTLNHTPGVTVSKIVI